MVLSGIVAYKLKNHVKMTLQDQRDEKLNTGTIKAIVEILTSLTLIGYCTRHPKKSTNISQLTNGFPAKIAPEE